MENFINHAFLVSIKSGGSMVDEYELIPEKEILELKKEINELKSHLGLKKQEDVVNDKKDVEEGQLIFAIKELTEVFKQAVAELKKQDTEPKKDNKKSEEKLSEDKGKIDILIEQNNKIAKGIVALADLLENNLQKLTEGLLQQPKIKYIRIPIPPQENTQTQYAPQYQPLYNQQTRTQGSYNQQQPLNPKRLPPQPPLNPSQLKGQVIPKAPPTLNQQNLNQGNQRIPNLNPQRANLQQGLMRKPSKRQIRF